jgi:hypothetical protein
VEHCEKILRRLGAFSKDKCEIGTVKKGTANIHRSMVEK